MSSLKLSILDLTPVSAGYSSIQTLQQSLVLASLADQLGYQRYWLSEHHNSNMLASASPDLLAGQIAARTQRIEVGTGGIMLPNHAPLKVAENFRLLEALYPGRINLGLGRAPGTDLRTALALRRAPEALQADDFPEQLSELMAYLHEKHPNKILAIPTGFSPPPVWLLGSSTFSAQLAAARGLSFAFAHHIQPEPAQLALQKYFQGFQPSPYLASPQAMIAVSAICAESDDAAAELAMSAELTMLRFRLNQGQPGPVPSVAEAQAQNYNALEQDLIASTRQRMFVGSPQTLRNKFEILAQQMGVQEIMISSLIHEPAARQRSFQLLAEAFELKSQIS